MSNSPSVTLAPLPTETERLLAELVALKAQLAEAQKKLSEPKTISLKVSEKGALSLYGMGRFPITMYKEQWRTILAETQSKAILDFISANETKLKAKGDETAEEAAARKARVDAYSAEAKARQGQTYTKGAGETGHKAV